MMENDDMFPRWFDPRSQFDDDDHRMAGRRGPGRHPRPPMPPHTGGGWRPGPGGPGWGGPHWGQMFGQMFGRSRARRGNVRSAILTLLADQAMNGYQFMQAIEQRSQGAWKPSSGSIYPTLQQLEDEGLVETEESKPGQSGSKSYKLSAEGKRYVDDNRDELVVDCAPDQDVGMEPRWELMNQFRQIAGAAAQVAKTGTPKQVDEAKKLLTEVRRNLYRILADMPEDEE